MKWLRRIAIGLVVLVVVGYLAGLAAMYLLQRDFQYDRRGRLLELSEARLPQAELVSFPTADGSPLAGWYQAPQAGKPLILYFRGNADSFSHEHERFEAFADAGYGFLGFDYRGFPGSPGEVTETHILEDAEAAWDWVAAKGFPIVIWGRSLGSGPATFIASRHEADALALETPFDSAVSVAFDRYWFFPVGLLMQDQFRVDEWLKAVDEPVWVGHGTGDTVIGVQHGEKVYELARNKDRLWIVPGADHGDLWAAGIWAEVRAFYERAEASEGR